MTTLTAPVEHGSAAMGWSPAHPYTLSSIKAAEGLPSAISAAAHDTTRESGPVQGLPPHGVEATSGTEEHSLASTSLPSLTGPLVSDVSSGPSSSERPSQSQSQHAAGHLAVPAGESASQASDDRFYDQHPFHRVPLVDEHFQDSSLDAAFSLGWGHTRENVGSAVSRINLLLGKWQLDERETIQLANRLGALVACAERISQQEETTLTPSRAVHALGLRLLVFDAVLAACEILGSNMGDND